MNIKTDGFYGMHIGDSFDVVELNNNPYTIKENGIVDVKGFLHPLLLDGIVFDIYHIKASKFTPQIDEDFYSIDLFGEEAIVVGEWKNDEMHQLLLERNMVFKTPEEALAKYEEIKRKLDE